MTEAPSIKEALEAALLILREYDFPGAHPHRRAVYDQVKAALATLQPDSERREPSCPFCNRDPFHYVDNGVGMEAVAVTCCDLGDLYFRGAREAPETVELSWEDFTGIGHRLASGLVQDEAGRPYCDPVKQGEAFYLAMYEKNGAHWPANEHQKLWVDMARDYERRRREAIRSARDGGEG